MENKKLPRDDNLPYMRYFKKFVKSRIKVYVSFKIFSLSSYKNNAYFLQKIQQLQKLMNLPLVPA